MARKGILEDKKGNIMVSIILLIGGIVMAFIVLTTLGPVLSVVVHSVDEVREENPTENFNSWYNTMLGHIRLVNVSVFMTLTALVIYVFINAIRRQWETHYFR